MEELVVVVVDDDDGVEEEACHRRNAVVAFPFRTRNWEEEEDNDSEACRDVEVVLVHAFASYCGSEEASYVDAILHYYSGFGRNAVEWGVEEEPWAW